MAMMSETWNILANIVTEGPGRPQKDVTTDLFKYIDNRYGEHEGKQLRKFARSVNNYPYFIRHVAMKFMDPKADKMARELLAAIQPSALKNSPAPPKMSQQAFAKKAGLGTRRTNYMQAADSPSNDKGFSDEPIPARPDRAGTQANVPPAQVTRLKPGEKPGPMPVGTAGQNQPKQAPSSQTLLPPEKTRHDMSVRRPSGQSTIRQQLGISADKAFKSDDSGDTKVRDRKSVV